MITPSWFSGSLRSFLYSSVYSCYLFLISSAFVRSILFLSFIEPIFAWNIPLVYLIFLKIYLVYPILLFCLFIYIDHWGRFSYLSLLFIKLKLKKYKQLSPDWPKIPTATSQKKRQNRANVKCLIFLTLLVCKELQIKTTLRYHFTNTRKTQITETDSRKYCKHVKQPELLHTLVMM